MLFRIDSSYHAFCEACKGGRFTLNQILVINIKTIIDYDYCYWWEFKLKQLIFIPKQELCSTAYGAPYSWSISSIF